MRCGPTSEAWSLPPAQGGAVLRGAADMHVGISEILRQRDDLAGAAQHLQQAAELGEENGLPQNPYRSRVAAARIRLARGRSSRRRSSFLARPTACTASDFSPDVRPVDALRARVWIDAGPAPGGAGLGARARPVGRRRPDLRPRVRARHPGQAAPRAGNARSAPRTPIARRSISSSGSWRRPRPAARNGQRDRHPGRPGARPSRRRRRGGARWRRLSARRRARRAGGLRPRLRRRGPADGGAAQARGQGAERVRATCATPRRRRSRPGATALADQPLIEPLSERELEVLRLLESDLDGPDIARELTVSLPTVRTHTSNIYAKLGVNESPRRRPPRQPSSACSSAATRRRTAG